MAQAGDFTYTTNNGTITITGYNCLGGEVTVPSTISGLPVTSIGDWAFSSCTSLTSVIIPNSVTSIEGGAFSYSSNLTSVIIPNSVTSIGPGVFANCTSLDAITVDTNNPTYSSVDGVLLNKNQTTLIQCPAGKAGAYAIPNSVTSIGYSAFDYCTNLTSVTIPNSVTNIEGGAFNFCTRLTSVSIPNSVTSIGHSAFSWCTGLTSVSIPNSVTSIGGGAFLKCAGLTNVVIGSGVSSIGNAAFFQCTGMTSVIIPNSVTSIGDDAFRYCTGLTNVVIGSGVTNVGDLAFSYGHGLTGVYFEGSAPKGSDAVFFASTKVVVYYLPGTMDWEPTYAGRLTALWVLPYPVILNLSPSLGVHTNVFGFRVSWATNTQVVVEASTTLTDPTWLPVSTNTLTDGLSYFSDPDWTNYPNRFYRIRSQ